MNESLEKYARDSLKSGLSKCTEREQEIFKLMYGRKCNGRGVPTRSVDESKAMNINDCVDEMETAKLDWAMTQVQNSLDKKEPKP